MNFILKQGALSFSSKLEEGFFSYKIGLAQSEKADCYVFIFKDLQHLHDVGEDPTRLLLIYRSSNIPLPSLATKRKPTLRDLNLHV